jgi:hypothetical protein
VRKLDGIVTGNNTRDTIIDDGVVYNRTYGLIARAPRGWKAVPESGSLFALYPTTEPREVIYAQELTAEDLADHDSPRDAVHAQLRESFRGQDVVGGDRDALATPAEHRQCGSSHDDERQDETHRREVFPQQRHGQHGHEHGGGVQQRRRSGDARARDRELVGHLEERYQHAPTEADQQPAAQVDAEEVALHHSERENPDDAEHEPPEADAGERASLGV